MTDALGLETPPPVEPEPAPETTGESEDEFVKALMARIAPVKRANRRLKMLVYGPPGTGKTTFAAGAPSPLVIDVEKGTTSLLNHAELASTAVLEFRSIKQLELLIEKCAEGHFDQFETLIIDSFSTLQGRDLDEILIAAAKVDSSRSKFIPTGPDYNINTNHMLQIANALRNLDKHIILTCHVKEDKDDATGRMLMRPNLTPKLATNLAGIVDVVAYMTINGQGENAVRSLQCHPTNTVTAKTRIGGLPAVIDNPKFADILSAFTA